MTRPSILPTLWPLLLILGGVGLVLRGTPIEALTGLAVAVVFGLIGGSLIAGGRIPSVGCGDTAATQPFPVRSGALGASAAVDIDLRCGELIVQTADGSSWRVEGTDADGQGPALEATTDQLHVRSQGTVVLRRQASDRWTVTLPAESRIDLHAQANAGAARLDLADARLGELRVDVNAGDATIDLSQAAAIEELDVQLNAVGSSRILLPALSLTGAVEGNAASGIRLCAPPGVGLRLTFAGSVASSNNYASRGLVEDGDVWETPNYDSAPVRIDLKTQVNAGSFELEPEGCHA